ncbi:MAG TPA: hypothetical protein VFP36_13880 [Usitatibacter sp.]|nr:hypothetical protein [Usitatibacter sp.]
MDRRNIAIFGIAVGVASFAALGEPPDFSPMRPDSLEGSQAVVESSGTEQDAQLVRREPAVVAPGVSTYAATPEPAPVYAPPTDTYVVREPSRAPARTASPPPPTAAYATIDHGLFNSRGPNDFGA